MMTYQNQYTYQHVGDHNERDENAGKIRLVGIQSMVDFGITNKLAATVGIPYNFGVYNGPIPHSFPADDGQYHGSLADFTFGLRYNLVSRPFQFTPFLVGVMPSHDYTFFAHSAVGQDTSEFIMGFSAGKQLEGVLRNSYVQGSVSQGISEEVLGMRPNRTRLAAQYGYFLNRRLQLQALSNLQFTHGGIDFAQVLAALQAAGPTSELFRHHDQLENVNFFDAGLGVEYSLFHNIDLSSSWMTEPWGQRGHALNSGLSIGVSWMFAMPWARSHMMHAVPRATNAEGR